MNTKLADRVFRILFVLAFVLGISGAPDTRARAQQGSSPTFNVMSDATNRHGRRDWVDGHGWMIGQPLEITVDDPDTTINPDASLEAVPVTECDGWPGTSCFDANFQGLYDIQAGDLVTVIQGSTIKTHEVLAVAITGADPGTDVVNGAADPFSQVQVDAWNNMSFAERQVTADGSGNWSVDFTDSDPDTADLELAAGSYLGAARFDDDGDSTKFGDRLPYPTISVNLQNDWLFVNDWPLGAEVHLMINGQDFGSAIVEAEGDSTSAHFDRGDSDIQIGDLIVVTDGVQEKSLTVSSFEVTGIDTNTDSVSGVGTPGAKVYASVYRDGNHIHRATTADDITGAWQVDFGGVVDIQAGSQGSAREDDDDGDSISFEWYVPTNPRFQVHYDGDQVSGWDWVPNSDVNISVDGSYIARAQTDEWGNFSADVQEIIIFAPGNYVEVTDGWSTKVHITANLSITSVNLEADVVYGTGTPERRVWVLGCDRESCIHRWETVDGAGNWSADFAAPGDEPGEEQTIDIVPGGGVDTREWDEDGDNTATGHSISNPYIQASAQADWVLANDWAEGTTVTLTINEIPYGSAVMGPASWNPNRIVGEFNLAGYNIQVGDVITVEGSGMAKSLTVSTIHITIVDSVANTVSGEASAGAEVYVRASPSGDWVERWITASDPGGEWSVDFTPDYDLVPGSNGFAQESDQDGDATLVDWFVPEQSPFAPFIVFGQEGVWIKENSDILSGDVIANSASNGPYLTDQSEVTIGQDTHFMDSASRVLGDTVYLKQGAQVYDVYYNELKGKGTLLGNHHNPIALPIVLQLPAVPNVTPGTHNFDLKRNDTLTLEAGNYGRLEAKRDTTITFTGGIYHFTEWSLGDHVKVYFTAPTEIRIAEKLDLGSEAYVGPVSGTQLTASDILIYVLGQNGKNGKINAAPASAKFGVSTTLAANVYAPHGTLWIREHSTATGAFFGRWVEIGQRVTLTLDNGWR